MSKLGLGCLRRTTTNELFVSLRPLLACSELPRLFQDGRIQGIRRIGSNNSKSLYGYLVVDHDRIPSGIRLAQLGKNHRTIATIPLIGQQKDQSLSNHTDKLEKSRIHTWLKTFNDYLLDLKTSSPKELESFRTHYEPLIHKDVSVQNILAAIDKDEYALRTHFETTFRLYLNPKLYEKSVSNRLTQAADIRAPHAWYPMTRRMKRKIIYHYGPTNSGKTYSALIALKKAQSGVYCAPLRLLAAEIYERLNFEGIYCNLITGQERKLVPKAHHYSMTVEMAHVYISEPIEVAVIDEIQMMADENRGYAWTEALFSLEAKEIHVCGNETALNLMRLICTETGDEFEAISYSRLTNLAISKHSLNGDLKKVREGDCLIVFSRRQIFEIRQELESKTSHRCCVVYGSLPPEVRVMQARLFNDPTSKYNVLVASDAVGMGLNL